MPTVADKVDTDKVSSHFPYPTSVADIVPFSTISLGYQCGRAVPDPTDNEGNDGAAAYTRQGSMVGDGAQPGATSVTPVTVPEDDTSDACGGISFTFFFGPYGSYSKFVIFLFFRGPFFISCVQRVGG